MGGASIPLTPVSRTPADSSNLTIGRNACGRAESTASRTPAVSCATWTRTTFWSSATPQSCRTVPAARSASCRSSSSVITRFRSASENAALRTASRCACAGSEISARSARSNPATSRVTRTATRSAALSMNTPPNAEASGPVKYPRTSGAISSAAASRASRSASSCAVRTAPSAVAPGSRPARHAALRSVTTCSPDGRPRSARYRTCSATGGSASAPVRSTAPLAGPASTAVATSTNAAVRQPKPRLFPRMVAPADPSRGAPPFGCPR
jgi:hypothetical protein